MSRATARRRRPTRGPLAGRVPVTAEHATAYKTGVMLIPRGELPMDQTLTPAQQRARLHQLLDTLPDAAVAAWLQLLDASGTPTTAPAPRGEAPICAYLSI